MRPNPLFGAVVTCFVWSAYRPEVNECVPPQLYSTHSDCLAKLLSASLRDQIMHGKQSCVCIRRVSVRSTDLSVPRPSPKKSWELWFMGIRITNLLHSYLELGAV